MIDKALSEACIGVPFPQRDIHFDTNQPLRVEVSSTENRNKPDVTKAGDSVK